MNIYQSFITLANQNEPEFAMYVCLLYCLISLVRQRGKIIKIIFDFKNLKKKLECPLSSSNVTHLGCNILKAVDNLMVCHQKLVECKRRKKTKIGKSINLRSSGTRKINSGPT
eukprot:UN00150